MPIAFTCAKCGIQGNAADWFGGKRGKCACGEIVDFAGKESDSGRKVGRLEKGENIDRRTGLDRRFQQVPDLAVQRRSGKERRQNWSPQTRKNKILGPTQTPAAETPKTPIKENRTSRRRVRIATIAWITYGSLVLLGTPLFVILFFAQTSSADRAAMGSLFSVIILALLALAHTIDRLSTR